MTEKSLLEQIKNYSHDLAPWLAYADWLEERGDLRGELVRLWRTLIDRIDIPHRAAIQARLQSLLRDGVAPANPTYSNSIGMDFVLIPPGRFRMGSPPNEPGRHDCENQVEVEITRGFWMAKYPVNQRQYETLMNPTSVVSLENYPAIYKNWRQATGFCRLLTATEHASHHLPATWEYRLPTEAQWEYACRAGMQTWYSFGDDASLLSEYAWYSGNSEGTPQPVGLKKPNAWGLHDMHGNVWEWCSDVYQKELPGGANPEAAATSFVYRVRRGGACDWPAEGCRTAVRIASRPRNRSSKSGFRLIAVQSSK